MPIHRLDLCWKTQPSHYSWYAHEWPEATRKGVLPDMHTELMYMCCRFPKMWSPADIAEEASEYHPLLSLAVISQPGLARGQTYPLISFQISKTLQVCYK